jgi:Ca-activated chloride channel family protein
MEATTRTIKKFENYRELFFWFVGAALIFLGLELLGSWRRLP